MSDNYDSSGDTTMHISMVREFLYKFEQELSIRGDCHDKSKLMSPEKEIFDKVTSKLKELTYGSPEYKESLKELGVALEHHYSENSHHPEHYKNGIDDMDLLDIVEMLMDWKAATLRHADGDILKSLEINKERFNISDQLCKILLNTVKNMKLDK